MIGRRRQQRVFDRGGDRRFVHRHPPCLRSFLLFSFPHPVGIQTEARRFSVFSHPPAPSLCRGDRGELLGAAV